MARVDHISQTNIEPVYFITLLASQNISVTHKPNTSQYTCAGHKRDTLVDTEMVELFYLDRRGVRNQFPQW